MPRIAFLDRDGTINVERHYLSDPQQVELLANTAAGIQALRELGLKVVVVTNQSGIGRGYFDHRALEHIHGRLRSLLVAAGTDVDAFYSCPHRPDDGCACRKPQAGLLEQAAHDLSARLEEAFVIGDQQCDVEMGRRAGATTLLVTTGYGLETSRQADVKPHYVVADLLEAAHVIAGLLGQQSVAGFRRSAP